MMQLILVITLTLILLPTLQSWQVVCWVTRVINIDMKIIIIIQIVTVVLLITAIVKIMVLMYNDKHISTNLPVELVHKEVAIQ